MSTDDPSWLYRPTAVDGKDTKIAGREITNSATLLAGVCLGASFPEPGCPAARGLDL